ncbi:NAD-P-binding protein [Athelia psychrophila]|uniref:NAD-P-binding protein n=1 Tax=Athelia psychrophila TaxID=1759441 RepID=A0A166M0F2_9AGAM|nr:NAD-P-binding protein [Fibularhizoctonia sp. CBS 109695]
MSTQKSELILVTGANGFLGSHIVHQLLEKGYRVRGTARGPKVALSREIFASYGDKFEVVTVNDTAKDDISEIVRGVDAVIHAAAPLPSHYKGGIEELIQAAVEGALNIIRQAEKGGVKRIIYTSSIVAVFNASGTLGPDDWSTVTTEQAVAGGPFPAYIKAKTEAEKAVWKFAEEHPQTDLTVLNPPYLFGPFAPNFKIPKPDFGALSTNLHFLHFLQKEGRWYPSSPGAADVRDVARIHVEALNSPPQSQVGPKRLPIASPYDANWKEAARFVREAYPDLVAKGRLVGPSTGPDFPFDKLPVDLERVKEVTGVEPSSYQPWKDTVLGAMADVIRFEKQWIAEGYKVEIPALEDYGF